MTEDFRAFGTQLRDFLTGFLASPMKAADKVSLIDATSVDVKSLDRGAFANGALAWGRVVDATGLKELYRGDGAPERHVKKQHPPAGVDHMRLKTVDVFRIPGMGEFTVPFEGYFQITRSEPSTNDWKTATVYVNFTDLKLFGNHPDLGDITVDLNPNVISAGNTFPARDATGQELGNVACRINVAARFHIEKLGMTLFNKTPIQLTNDDVQGIPTIGEGGKANVSSLPMYRWDNPNGGLYGYVEELEYTVLNYATHEEATLHKTAKNRTEYEALVNVK